MNVPNNLKYTKDHEWLKIEGDVAYIGVTDYAQSQLGDIVFVDVTTEGETLEKEEALGTIEAVKTVSDVYMPVGGEVIEFNTKLEDNADLINKDPYGDGWIVKVKLSDPEEIKALLSPEAYKEIIGA
ncbi:MAG: glycine cleavage system protein GcvH [Bacteroidia bacterium]|nr:glycine cleavage system protein GcvH [Bacteroidales bacterium]NCD40680.1 glycine cleavage system protein GcvH [Bacteroidia bacterium]MDD2323179.1 glycine cleavage system protein GcvH [Bacteroidales bacterium]MDD3010716.1 glycine cleavage system protein GcvH [Bacteroidales bacterium]MDD3961910.1 glycine cleavage system protein GcvH [Bacteroidales bacterium]